MKPRLLLVFAALAVFLGIAGFPRDAKEDIPPVNYPLNFTQIYQRRAWIGWTDAAGRKHERRMSEAAWEARFPVARAEEIEP